MINFLVFSEERFKLLKAATKRGRTMISTLSQNAVMERKNTERRFGRILIDRKIINKDQLDHALALQVEGESCDYCGEIMIRLGYITEKHITEVLACQYRLPYISLEKYKINKRVLEIIPFSLAAKHLFIPLDRIGSFVTVAMANPQDYDVVRKISVHTRCRVCILVSTASEIKTALNVNYGIGIDEHKATIADNYSFRSNQ